MNETLACHCFNEGLHVWSWERRSCKLILAEMENVLAFLLVVFSIHLIAQYLGRKREIGYGKSVMWCLLLSPFIGIFIVLSSGKLDKSDEAILDISEEEKQL